MVPCGCCEEPVVACGACCLLRHSEGRYQKQVPNEKFAVYERVSKLDGAAKKWSSAHDHGVLPYFLTRISLEGSRGALAHSFVADERRLLALGRHSTAASLTTNQGLMTDEDSAAARSDVSLAWLVERA